MTKPLILVTNDDGIDSAGLWAAVEALLPLGEILVVAPDRQWSGAGRSMPGDVTGTFNLSERAVAEYTVQAYAIDASPALCVIHAMEEMASRPPALVVSGINFGENVSTEVTVSGTVGAALEAAAYGVPAMAISLEMPIAEHHTGGVAKDYAPAQAFTLRFARRLLERDLPPGVDVLNLNVPAQATAETPWQLTRLSRHRYFLPLTPDREGGTGRPGYRVLEDPSAVERDSDIWALRVEGFVSVTPLTMDLTAGVDFGIVAERLDHNKA